MNKSKKSDLPKSKKLILPKDFVKANSGTGFLIFKFKKPSYTYKKPFSKHHLLSFNLKHDICIEFDFLKYAIKKVQTKITLDEYFSNQVIHKNHFIFSQIVIDQ